MGDLVPQSGALSRGLKKGGSRTARAISPPTKLVLGRSLTHLGDLGVNFRLEQKFFRGEPSVPLKKASQISTDFGLKKGSDLPLARQALLGDATRVLQRALQAANDRNHAACLLGVAPLALQRALFPGSKPATFHFRAKFRPNLNLGLGSLGEGPCSLRTAPGASLRPGLGPGPLGRGPYRNWREAKIFENPYTKAPPIGSPIGQPMRIFSV